MNGEATLRVSLAAPVPVFIYYVTALVRDGGAAEFWDDINGMEEALDRALRRSAGSRSPGAVEAAVAVRP